jgi:hypothetical protein
MRSYFVKHENGTTSSWKFKAGKLVLYVTRHRGLGDSTLTMTIPRWRFVVSCASTATVFSAPDGTQLR